MAGAPHWDILSREQAVQVHERALHLLAHTGIVFQSDTVVRRFAEAGAQVDEDKQLVRLPTKLVEELLASVPREFRLGAADPGLDCIASTGATLCRPIVGCSYVLDSQTGERREPTSADARDIAHLLDGLSTYSFGGTVAYPSDEAPMSRDVYYLKLLLENARKHVIVSPYGAQNIAYMYEMAVAVAGSEAAQRERPRFHVLTAPTSPLRFSETQTEMIVKAAELMIPNQMSSTPMAGATSPVTLAGQTLLLHAENLAGIALTQLIQPGCPVYYASRANSMDMRTGNSLWGAVEWALTGAACLQIARGLGLICDSFGCISDSKTMDEQAAIEKTMSATLVALAGANIISGGGYLETINTTSLEQLVIDDEIQGMLYRVLQGVEVSEETLAEDLIDRVGPGGNYLGEEHTRRHYRREHYLPKVLDRDLWDVWQAKGGKDLVQKARERAQSLLSAVQPVPLPGETSRELERILKAARTALVAV
ncbi:MAG: trimethylamine methyltransferase family protein [Chloroflexota bacterium]